MPLWLKRSLFLLVVIVAAWLEGVYLAAFGFGTVALALAITVILAIGWMRTLLEGVTVGLARVRPCTIAIIMPKPKA